MHSELTSTQLGVAGRMSTTDEIELAGGGKIR